MKTSILLSFFTVILLQLSGCEYIIEQLTSRLSGQRNPPSGGSVEEVICTLVVLPEDARIPARVGPGLNRAIFRYLTNADGVLTVDGHVFDLPDTWYRIVYNDQQLWISHEDLGLSELRWSDEQDGDPDAPDCLPPLVAVPPEFDTASTEGVTSFQDFPVYHCRHLGSSQFEWVSARVTYDAAGIPISEEITGGPFQGEWRDGCPAGDQPGQSDPGGNPPPPPTPPPGN